MYLYIHISIYLSLPLSTYIDTCKMGGTSRDSRSGSRGPGSGSPPPGSHDIIHNTSDYVCTHICIYIYIYRERYTYMLVFVLFVYPTLLD